ncbi:MAG: DUF2721 domain-containing protein [Bacteroidales bacterium]|nr:DUF2721 domain-containing protein [Bacteroidales bacterium]
MEPTTSFIQFLQASITPVALISGVGLLLLTITNRLGRVIDRTRHLIAELNQPDTPRQAVKKNEIDILMKRGTLLRISIAFITLSILFSCLIIPLLVIMRTTSYDLRTLGNVLFIFSIISILISAVCFFFDILLTLSAIKLEVKEFCNDEQC